MINEKVNPHQLQVIETLRIVSKLYERRRYFNRLLERRRSTDSQPEIANRNRVAK
jgi:hypothetical protein